MAEMISVEIGEKSRNGDNTNSNGNNKAAAILPQHPKATEEMPNKSDQPVASVAAAAAAAINASVKRRKTRRGKTKRRNVNVTHPMYIKNNGKPEAPYNSNRFLIEDHGDELDEDFDASTSSITRTRDSSFSMEDSDDNTPYLNPSLIRDFDNQYESLQMERLQSMSKDELIQDFIRYEHMMERKVDLLVAEMKKKPKGGEGEGKCLNDECRKEAQRITLENDMLRQENESMKATISTDSDDSADSESDSADSSDTVSGSSASSLYPPSSPRPPTPPDSNPPSAEAVQQQHLQQQQANGDDHDHIAAVADHPPAADAPPSVEVPLNE